MKSLFDQHRHSLSKGEREKLWWKIQELSSRKPLHKRMRTTRLVPLIAVVVSVIVGGRLWVQTAGTNKMVVEPTHTFQYTGMDSVPVSYFAGLSEGQILVSTSHTIVDLYSWDWNTDVSYTGATVYSEPEPGSYIVLRGQSQQYPPLQPPNGEPFGSMHFKHRGTNPFIVTEEDSLSTFALDVDNASFTLALEYLNRDELPPESAIRVEEFLNYFDQGYSCASGSPLSIHLDGAPSPFAEGYHLLRIGVQAVEALEKDRVKANLVFVVDTSGSMRRENRLGLVKQALLTLLDELKSSDTVSIVEYGSSASVVLGPTSLDMREKVIATVQNLSANGSTNAEAGLELAYELASRQLNSESNTRIVLCSDGVANTGETQAERILKRARLESDRGVSLSVIGFGMGNYNDVFMEELSNKGDGNYYYVNNTREATRVFRENLTGVMQTLARDAKVQVQFNPETVLRWRLIGYENREAEDGDFRNDEVDAGEIGFGQQAVALYEVKLSDKARRLVQKGSEGNSAILGEAMLRFEHPQHSDRAGTIEEISARIKTDQIEANIKETSVEYRLSSIVAEFGEILGGSFWAKGSTLSGLYRSAVDLLGDSDKDEHVEELLSQIRKAAKLEQAASE
jgi:Ca-activated chloride channel family protein